jgi:hypothetical protein
VLNHADQPNQPIRLKMVSREGLNVRMTWPKVLPHANRNRLDVTVGMAAMCEASFSNSYKAEI